MSSLESIVPPLELCKRIPIGEFDDSALVFRQYVARGEDKVCPRAQYEGVVGDRPVPAPTLDEILKALGDLGAVFCECWIRVGSLLLEYPVGAEKALRLWFKVKVIGELNESFRN